MDAQFNGIHTFVQQAIYQAATDTTTTSKTSVSAPFLHPSQV